MLGFTSGDPATQRASDPHASATVRVDNMVGCSFATNCHFTLQAYGVGEGAIASNGGVQPHALFHN